LTNRFGLEKGCTLVSRKLIRSAGNFHPEWGYLAPAPSFMRTARIVAVAMAVGATAGVGVVVSLVAAHALVMGVQAAASEATPAMPVNTFPAAQPQVNAHVNAQPAVVNRMSLPPTSASPASAGTNEASAISTSQVAASVAAVAKAPPVTDVSPEQAPNEAAATPDEAHAPKNMAKKHRAARHEPLRQWPANGDEGRTKLTQNDRGFGPTLLRLFSVRTGSSY